jgi:hypothetical protein
MEGEINIKDFEETINASLDAVMDECKKVVYEQKFDGNYFKALLKSGSSGAQCCMGQMMGCIGTEYYGDIKKPKKKCNFPTIELTKNEIIEDQNDHN